MDWARRIIPPGWLLVALLMSAALHHWSPIDQLLSAPVSRLGVVPLAAGLLLTTAGVVAFRRARTPVIPFQRSTTLVTGGIYRFTRNPMYVGLVLVLGGTAMLLGSIGAFVPLPLFVAVIEFGYIHAEERFLAEIFGDDYLHYRHEVRRWLGFAQVIHKQSTKRVRYAASHGDPIPAPPRGAERGARHLQFPEPHRPGAEDG
jgi:protein-S-isoprenylcysteine O-methyltransferase Ste14